MAESRDLEVCGSNAAKLYAKILRRNVFMSTGISKLDAMLCGGFQAGELVEIAGSTITGKSQFCMCLAVAAAVQGYSCAYFDLLGHFSSVRIRELIATSFTPTGLESDFDVIKRIFLIRESDIFGLLDGVDRLCEDFAAKSTRIKRMALVVIDSLPAVMMGIRSDQNALSEDMLTTISTKLKQMAKRRHLVVLVVNNAKAYSEEGFRTTLGRYWATVPQVRLLFSRNEPLKTAEAPSILPICIKLIRSVRTPVGGSVPAILDERGFSGAD